jgi:hypothetical protein
MATTTSIPNNNSMNIPQSKKHIPNWLIGSVLLIVLALLILGARWITQAAPASALGAPSVPLAYDATGAMLNSVVFPKYREQRIHSAASRYDATGAMLNAVVFSHEAQRVSRPLAYDATGAMLNAVVFSHEARLASRPLPYDATGAMLEAVVFPTYPE